MRILMSLQTFPKDARKNYFEAFSLYDPFYHLILLNSESVSSEEKKQQTFDLIDTVSKFLQIRESDISSIISTSHWSLLCRLEERGAIPITKEIVRMVIDSGRGIFLRHLLQSSFDVYKEVRSMYYDEKFQLMETLRDRLLHVDYVFKKDMKEELEEAIQILSNLL